MKKEFRKRVFTPASLLANALDIVKDLPRLPRLMRPDSVSPAFRERLFLAVTSVNQCRYCTWLHSDLSQKSGVTESQVLALLGGNVTENFGEEGEALSYAIHFAESERRPDAAQTAALFARYGEAKARQIVHYLNLIYFSNLSGNTFDAFTSRLAGTPGDGNALFEAAFAAVSAPVLLAIRARYAGQD